MSECVVRMEIPKSCWVCPFGIDGYLWNENDARTYHVRLCSQHRGVEYRVLKTDDSDRPWYCDSFICQLPEGHGRLVDADACAGVLRKLENEAVKPTEKLCFGYAAKMFEEAFTIVPAESETYVMEIDQLLHDLNRVGNILFVAGVPISTVFLILWFLTSWLPTLWISGILAVLVIIGIYMKIVSISVCI